MLCLGEPLGNFWVITVFSWHFSHSEERERIGPKPLAPGKEGLLEKPRQPMIAVPPPPPMRTEIPPPPPRMSMIPLPPPGPPPMGPPGFMGKCLWGVSWSELGHGFILWNFCSLLLGNFPCVCVFILCLSYCLATQWMIPIACLACLMPWKRTYLV